MVLVIDNYDSFTYNLVQYLGELGARVVVRRNNETSLDEIRTLMPDHIVISPGPGRPEDAGISLQVIRTFGSERPILGVCLGHQAIGLACGGAVVRAPIPIHGKTSTVDHDGTGVFAGIGRGFEAGRYHSLVVDEQGLPDELVVSARSRNDRLIMGLRHRRWPLHGVQFHPESVLTQEGRQLLRNFLAL
ncbi:MAG TPA: aminodeoxychorismate/anthranilate synthase component II [Vicinamibacterales bacterium]|jgi:anthranilate synthase/aminodeoxychorismate synthase-like glutamine amidotransferase|nr:aminodeoxychorismate/anthranilate synthase component II [Vicinamibacterales bacterium]